MPPRTSLTKERVYEAAFGLLRREGLESITARRVAQELGCSTQPVYTACGGMDAVREEAYRMAVRFIFAAMDGYPGGTGNATLDRICGYLHLAKNEKRLYQSVYMTARDELTDYRDKVIGDGLLTAHLQTNTRPNRCLDEVGRREVLRHLGVYLTGLGTIFNTDSNGFSMEQAVTMFEEVYHALLTERLSRGA